MRYYVTLEGRTVEVDLSGDVARVDGEPVAVELGGVPGVPIRHLTVGGRSHVVVARQEDRETWDLQVDGERVRARVVDERTRAIRAMTGQGAVARGPRPVRAPMPGLVVRVAVRPGDRVDAGQSVAVIEAMKMENDLKAEAAAVVSAVAVEAGQAVEKGTVLVEFETAEAGSG